MENKQELIRLNKYLAHAEIADRRKCDEFIKQGLVKVNDRLITETGTKVSLHDIVKFRDQIVNPGKKVYILINKPKGFVINKTEGKKSLIDLVKSFSEKLKIGYTPQLFSLDSLQEKELGLVLLTNDIELQKYYSSNKLNSVFNIHLDTEIFENDFNKLLKQFDELSILDEDYLNLGIKTGSADSERIINTFNTLGYKIERLDRTIVAGITKRDLPRGKWRFLKPKEVVSLKYFGKK